MNIRLLFKIMLISCFLFSCEKKVNTTNNTNPFNNDNNNNNNNGNNTTTPIDILTPGPCVADYNQTIDCYVLTDISFHGQSTDTVVWSSEIDMSSNDQQRFITDSRINIQIIPRFKDKGFDSRGNSCLYDHRPYTKLKVGIKVRSPENTYGSLYYHVFENLSPDIPSNIYEFTPANTTGPQVIEILNVQWDYTCIDYANRGFPNKPDVCPWADVWNTECISLDLKVATDYTKNLAGPREQ